MARRTGLISVLVLAVWLLPAAGEEGTKGPPRGLEENEGAAPPAGKRRPSLAEVTRASTDEAARSAVRAKTKSESSEEEQVGGEEAAVIELQPARPEGRVSGTVVTPSQNKKESPLENGHGSVYGEGGAGEVGRRRAGGAVGATTKGGKAAIYVEAERQRQTSPPPR